MKNISINNKFKYENAISEYLNPEYIYINSNNNTLLNKDVLLGEKLDEYIYSPVSGKVIESNNNILTIVNDFKETSSLNKSSNKYLNRYSKKEFYSLVTGFNLEAFAVNNPNIMVINGIDIDPFEKNISYIINDNTTKILDTIDAVATILDINHVILCISNSDSKNVLNLTNNIGTYPNIKLKILANYYPISYEQILLKSILSKKELNDNILYLTVDDIYNLYYILKRKKPIIEKYITVSGNMVKASKVIKVKIGTKIGDILKNNITIKDGDYKIVINGLMNGKEVRADDFITPDTRSVFVTTTIKECEKECINCGLCTEHCPVNLNPKYLHSHHKTSDRCINCGLCTYICPAKINFKNLVGGNHE